MTTAIRNTIGLKGSIAFITDYFYYAINSILYQRSIFPVEMFKSIEKYEIKLFELRDKEINAYFDQILGQIRKWAESGNLQRIVLVIKEAATGETIERWQFIIEADNSSEIEKAKIDESKIKHQIRDVLRQIFASVALLPTLDSEYSFDMLVYTAQNAEIPDGWDKTGPHLIKNAENVPLKSFTTSVHRVESSVTYKTL